MAAARRSRCTRRTPRGCSSPAGARVQGQEARRPRLPGLQHARAPARGLPRGGARQPRARARISTWVCARSSGARPASSSRASMPAGAIEYAVEMRSFAEADTLAGLIATGGLTGEHVRAVARRLAAFHRTAPVVAGGGPGEVLGDVARQRARAGGGAAARADWHVDVAEGFGAAFVRAHEREIERRRRRRARSRRARRPALRARAGASRPCAWSTVWSSTPRCGTPTSPATWRS